MELIKTGLYGLAFLWTLLITALVGNVIADASGGTPSQVNYCMFAAVFSWITLLVGVASSFTSALPIIANLALDGLAVFFTFVAGVLLAAKLGVYSCSNMDYVNTNDTTSGSPDPSKRCRELQASCAFFWFLFATYCASLALSLMSGRSSGMSSRGGIHKGPSMSQV